MVLRTSRSRSEDHTRTFEAQARFMILTRGLPHVLQHVAVEVVQTSVTLRPNSLEANSAVIGAPCLFRVVKECASNQIFSLMSNSRQTAQCCQIIVDPSRNTQSSLAQFRSFRTVFTLCYKILVMY